MLWGNSNPRWLGACFGWGEAPPSLRNFPLWDDPYNIIIDYLACPLSFWLHPLTLELYFINYMLEGGASPPHANYSKKPTSVGLTSRQAAMLNTYLTISTTGRYMRKDSNLERIRKIVIFTQLEQCIPLADPIRDYLLGEAPSQTRLV